MRHLFPLFLVAALFAAPPVLAHLMLAPNPFCETRYEREVHHYVGDAGLNEKTLGERREGAALVVDGAFHAVCKTDNHHEWGLGAAILVAAYPTLSSCMLEAPHHFLGAIAVEDVAYGSGVTFTVAADNVDSDGNLACDGVIDADAAGVLVEAGPLTDQAVKCFGSCVPSFYPGTDGAYWVFIHPPAIQGHVFG